MTDPAIRAALRAGALATIPNAAAAGDEPSRLEIERTAAAVAAFLRGYATPQKPGFVSHFGHLAAAVEAAAREAGE